MVFDFSKLIRKYPIGRSVTILVDGNKEKITVCGYKFSNATWYVDTKESGIFLLSRMEMLEVKPERPVDLKELLDDVIADMCDNYCKFPDCYEDEEELREQKCSRCQLNRLNVRMM